MGWRLEFGKRRERKGHRLVEGKQTKEGKKEGRKEGGRKQRKKEEKRIIWVTRKGGSVGRGNWLYRHLPGVLAVHEVNRGFIPGTPRIQCFAPHALFRPRFSLFPHRSTRSAGHTLPFSSLHCVFSVECFSLRLFLLTCLPFQFKSKPRVSKKLFEMSWVALMSSLKTTCWRLYDAHLNLHASITEDFESRCLTVSLGLLL